MRRHLLWLLPLASTLLVAGAPYLLAQESQAQETAALDTVTKWKVINTAIFVIGLCYVLWKYAPGFFNARSADIQKAIKDATGLKIEAEFRYSEIDRKMASLADEVKKMRDRAAAELGREHERFRHETKVEIGHIQHNVMAEVEAFRKEGMHRIRQHIAQLSIELAERHLQDRFRPGEGDDFIRDFIHLVERGKN